MGVGQAFNTRDKLIHAGVVLHGAGAQRIHTQVDGVVPGGEPREVADDLDLAQFWEQAGRVAMRFAEQSFRVDRGNIQRRQLVRFFARRGFLKYQALVLRLMGANFARRLSLNYCFRRRPSFKSSQLRFVTRARL